MRAGQSCPSNYSPNGDKKTESRILFLKSASQTCVDLGGFKPKGTARTGQLDFFPIDFCSKERQQNTARKNRRKDFLKKIQKKFLARYHTQTTATPLQPNQ
jgi:hypothetical protein